ncbi:hypothetical protein Anapl_07961 [Anas platyrhynchos]|uniref:Uncharacterized protein n=1 Tax=Anas platyrhynchos TaxID=8839 RepID=R0L1M3_ANAPL|nr:hypothetical protein Anapl_07961 [Anas platyrhynchos]
MPLRVSRRQSSPRGTLTHGYVALLCLQKQKSQVLCEPSRGVCKACSSPSTPSSCRLLSSPVPVILPQGEVADIRMLAKCRSLGRRKCRDRFRGVERTSAFALQAAGEEWFNQIFSFCNRFLNKSAKGDIRTLSMTKTHTEVSQCPDPDLHRCGGRTRTIPADPVVICQYLRVAQKCVSEGSRQLSALHVSICNGRKGVLLAGVVFFILFAYTAIRDSSDHCSCLTESPRLLWEQWSPREQWVMHLWVSKRGHILSCLFVILGSWMAEPPKLPGSWTKHFVTSFISCLAAVACTGFIKSWYYASLRGSESNGSSCMTGADPEAERAGCVEPAEEETHTKNIYNWKFNGCALTDLVLTKNNVLAKGLPNQAPTHGYEDFSHGPQGTIFYPWFLGCKITVRTYYVLQPEFLIQNLPFNRHPDNAEKLPGDFSLSPSFFCPQIHAVPNRLRVGAKGAHFNTADQDKEVKQCPITFAWEQRVHISIPQTKTRRGTVRPLSDPPKGVLDWELAINFKSLITVLCQAAFHPGGRAPGREGPEVAVGQAGVLILWGSQGSDQMPLSQWYQNCSVDVTFWFHCLETSQPPAGVSPADNVPIASPQLHSWGTHPQWKPMLHLRNNLKKATSWKNKTSQYCTQKEPAIVHRVQRRISSTATVRKVPGCWLRWWFAQPLKPRRRAALNEPRTGNASTWSTRLPPPCSLPGDSGWLPIRVSPICACVLVIQETEAEYSDEKVLINELCAPNFETGMRMESSLFFNAGTKLQDVDLKACQEALDNSCPHQENNQLKLEKEEEGGDINQVNDEKNERRENFKVEVRENVDFITEVKVVQETE